MNDSHWSGLFRTMFSVGEVTVTEEYYMEGVIQTEFTIEGNSAMVRPYTYELVVDMDER